jgi:hypothetical protein
MQPAPQLRVSAPDIPELPRLTAGITVFTQIRSQRWEHKLARGQSGSFHLRPSRIMIQDILTNVSSV